MNNVRRTYYIFHSKHITVFHHGRTDGWTNVCRESVGRQSVGVERERERREVEGWGGGDVVDYQLGIRPQSHVPRLALVRLVVVDSLTHLFLLSFSLFCCLT